MLGVVALLKYRLSTKFCNNRTNLHGYVSFIYVSFDTGQCRTWQARRDTRQIGQRRPRNIKWGLYFKRIVDFHCTNPPH